MPETSKYSGLCETCEHDATCMLRRSSLLKIIQCEEFSIQQSPAKSNGSRVQEDISDNAESASFGICVNCLHVNCCGFPDARQGVSHCEEYLLDEKGLNPPPRPARSESAA